MSISTESRLQDAEIDDQVFVATTAQELERLREFWSRNNVHPDADIDFYRLFASLRPEVISPYVIVAARNGVPKALFIGRLEEASVSLRFGYFEILKVPVRQLTFLQDGLLGDQSPALTAAIVAKISACLKEARADRALICNVSMEAPLFQVSKTLPGFFARDHAGESTSHWRTTLPDSLEEFLKRRSSKHRYWLRRIVRVFEEAHQGKVEYRLLKEKGEIEWFCTHAEAIAKSTYQRGLGVGFSDTSETRQRLDLALAKGWLKAYMLLADGKPVAFWFGRMYGQVMYLEWTGYDPAYRNYEVGTILFLKMIEDLCRCGAREMDYGTGASFYKERFGNQSREEALVSIYSPTLKGFSLSLLKAVESRLNKAAKAVARRLKIIDHVKKLWRGKLAGRSGPEEAIQPSPE